MRRDKKLEALFASNDRLNSRRAPKRRAKQEAKLHHALKDTEDTILHGRAVYSVFRNPTGWYTCVITTEGLVLCATAAATTPGMAAARAMEALVRSSILRKKRG